MTFFSRPDLSDIQFKQLNDSVLTLSGQTRVVTTSGLTLSDGNGGNIIISAEGAGIGSSGHVMTYIDGVIKLAPSGATSDIVFDSNRFTTRSGVPSVRVSGTTVKDFLEGYFFPSVPPSTSLSINGSVTRQFGDTSTGGTLTWGVTRNTNPITTICANTNGGGSYNCTILNGGCISSTGGTIPYTISVGCSTPATGTSSTYTTYALCAKSIINENVGTSVSITWQNKKYFFANSTLYTNNSINSIITASGGQFSTTRALTTTMTFNNQFFYYAYPVSYGLPTFNINGLPNNAWGNITTGSLFIINYVNSDGYSNPYYVARSDNRITGQYTIIVS